MITFRISRKLYDSMHQDLQRPHPFAFERIGFLRARTSATDNGLLLLAAEYRTVLDERYIEDFRSGARIDGQAIRDAMQWALDTNDSIFHVHMHRGRGVPGFSRMDMAEIPRIVESIHNVVPSTHPGMIVMNSARSFALVGANSDLMPIDKFSIIGYPTTFHSL